MGNICEAIGVTRKDATAFGNQTPTGNSPADPNSGGVEVVEAPTPSPKDSLSSGESKSPVTTTKKRAESVDTNTAEIKLAFAKKQSDEAAAAAAVEVLTGPRLRLLPHQHTLFCERKQRVCSAVGQQQEMEVVKLEGFKDVPNFCWIRIKPENVDKFSEEAEDETDLAPFYEVIEQKQTHAEGEREVGELEYSLSREDVGHFLGVRYEFTPALVAEDTEGAQKVHHKYVTLLRHGVVLPGPPRLTDFSVTGSMQVGTMAVAEVSYIGGHEGPTEYWWMRISPEGKRTQVTEPRPIPYTPTATLNPLVAPADDAAPAAAPAETVSSTSDGVAVSDVVVTPAATETGDADAATATEDSTAATTGEATTANAAQLSNTAEGEQLDPRYYKLTEADLGCCLKAKCRPTRSDGVQGEIFTSTSSEEVVA